ncbi:hypothetical protein [Actinoplanes subglobosus]|uniref:Uncharacterized protein n=1 Tax=Actinoplanes subglobosus TaxID=1547892 RepID=A0ABV8JC12_9ACTN
MVDPDPHAQPLLSTPAYRQPETMSATTRHLSAAPYLDISFANVVIREVLESERKAVPPSYGFDLDPVVRHSLRARRLLLLRYGLVTIVLIVGFCLSPIATIGWLLLCGIVVGFRSRILGGLPPQVRMGIIAAIALSVLCLGGYWLVQSMSGDIGDILFGSSGSDYYGSDFGGDDFGFTYLDFLYPVVLTAAMFAVLFLSRRHVLGVIITELAPGTPNSAPRSANARVERRLAIVAGMQRGNMSVHDRYPFLGAGQFRHGWDLAVTLNPADKEKATGRIRIDGAVLNRRVAEAIVALRSPALSDGEKVPNVFVVPYVVANGWRRTDDPLIDPNTRAPYTQASPETLAAIEGSPQGGMRYYLRAVVPAHGKEIQTPGRRPVLPAQDSGVAVTAFVHLAVEGGMLYVEFVATVMPEVQRFYQLGDILRPERAPAYAAAATFGNFVRENLLAPLWFVQIGWDAFRLSGRMAKSAREAEELRFHDYGADLSVRDLGADYPIDKFLNHLDAAKYISLLDKAVVEEVLNFLDEHGVDTGEFRMKAANVSFDFSTKTFSGGQQIFGNNNRINQTNFPKAPGGGSGG